MDEKIEELNVFLSQIKNPKNWGQEEIDSIIKKCCFYSNFFQESEEEFQTFAPVIQQFISPPENAKELEDYFLSYALLNFDNLKTSLVIKSYITNIPQGRERAKSILANFLRKNAVESILLSNTSEAFIPYITANQIISHQKKNPEDIITADNAPAALIALARNPNLLPNVADCIKMKFDSLPPQDIVNAALASNEIMKFVLSNTVPLILNGNDLGFEIIQKLAASHNPKPAQIVAKELLIKKGIRCLF